MTRHIIRLVFFLTLYCQLVYAQETEESIASTYNIESCRYWLDDDYTSREIAFVSGTSTIDVSNLTEGFHTVRYQVIDSKGEVSPARTLSFFRYVEQKKDENFREYSIKALRYWFDSNYPPNEVAFINGTSTIDVSQLTEGFHTLCYQAVDSKGEVSPSRTISFFRYVEQEKDEHFKEYSIKALRYWFDGVYTPYETAYINGTSTIDVSQLTEGFHTLCYQAIDSKGEMSPSRTISFFRYVEQEKDEHFKEYTIKALRYWFDSNYIPHETAYLSGTSTIDVSQLPEGFHMLHYQAIDSKGEASPARSLSFFRYVEQEKDELSKEYTVQTVRYWFDDNDANTRTTSYASGVFAIDLENMSEGTHSLHFQLQTDGGELAPTRSVEVYRSLYDLYISKQTEFNDSLLSNDPLFASRPDIKLHHQPEDINVRGHLTVGSDTPLSLGKFVQTGNMGYNYNSSKYAKAGVEYFHPTTLVNNGFMRADSVIVKETFYRDRWHFLSLPFNVKVSEINVPNDTYWVLRGYDSEARAEGGKENTWFNLQKDGIMEARKGYILQLTKEGTEKTSELIFKAQNDPKKNDIFTTEDVDIPLEEHPSEFAHNRSWNLVGNPYPSFFDTRCIEQNGTIIVWNGNGYTAYSLDDDNYILMPFEAFFIQKPLNNNTLLFNKEGRQHTHEILSRAASRNQAKSLQNRRILNFSISDGVDTDRSRVVINEQASIGYETDKDAPKFMEARPNIPQLFTLECGVQYSINERPIGDGQIVFSLYVPVDGEYHFSVDDDVTNMIVLDTETGTSWAMADGDYVFTATEGMHNARLLVSLTGKPTVIAQINPYDDGEIKVADGQISFRFVRNKHIKVFSVDGRILYNDVASQTSIKVARGIYVVDLDGKTTKIMVK